MATPFPPITILRRKKVEAKTGLSRSTIYDLIKIGGFPAPIKVGPKAVGWLEHEIEAWLAAKVEESRKAKAA